MEMFHSFGMFDWHISSKFDWHRTHTGRKRVSLWSSIRYTINHSFKDQPLSVSGCGRTLYGWWLSDIDILIIINMSPSAAAAIEYVIINKTEYGL